MGHVVLFFRKILMITVSKISYDSALPDTSYKERHRERPLLEGLSAMSDKDILCASLKSANEQASKTTAARVLENGPSLFLAATSVVYGAMSKGTLSTKVKETGILALGGVIAYNSAKALGNAVNDKKSESSDNNKDSKLKSIAKTAVISVAAAGAAVLALKGGAKAVDKLAEKFEPQANAIKENLNKKAMWLNNTKLGKFAEQQTKNAELFAKNHPKLAAAGEVMGLLTPIAAAIGIGDEMKTKVENKRNETFKSNAEKLLVLREAAGETLSIKNN